MNSGGCCALYHQGSFRSIKGSSNTPQPHRTLLYLILDCMWHLGTVRVLSAMHRHPVQSAMRSLLAYLPDTKTLTFNDSIFLLEFCS